MDHRRQTRNMLTPSELERLAMLAEEAGEVIQIVGKIMRHGYESWHPDTGEINRDLLHGELSDLYGIVQSMVLNGDIRDISFEDSDAAWLKKLRYSHYQ